MRGVPSKRRCVRAGVAGALAAVMCALAPGGPATAAGAGASPGSGTALQVFYRSPVLVRLGETVRIPVDVVCVRAGAACAAQARVTVAGRPARTSSAPAAAGLEFDLTAPAQRAAALGRLEYVVSASAPGASMSLPGPGGGSLHVYVARRMPELALPALAPGAYARGTQVLFMPWGSGERSAGLSVGNEALTLGPSSFAVGPDASIHVADAFHDRIAVFREGRLIASLDLAMSPQTDLAVGTDGETFVASDDAIGARTTRFTVLDQGGDLEAFRTVPGTILAGVGTDGSTGYARFLPLDAWTAFPGGSGQPNTGLPLPGGGQFLRSVVDDSVRLGIADGTRVRGAVELRSTQTLGDLAFASTDGDGGYVAVVRVVNGGTDQYEVVHVRRDLSVDAFAVPSHQYAGTMPAGRFRLGPDGALYQLITSPDGLRILRYEIGGTR